MSSWTVSRAKSKISITEGGNKYILTCVDYLSRYTIVAELQSKEASEVGRAIRDNAICQWCPPEVIISDQGSKFRNKVLKRLAKIGGFSHRMITIYHPASNGLVDNHNKQLISILHSITDELSPTDWDRHLKTAQLALNSAYHSSVDDTLYYAVYGPDPIIPNAALTNLSSKYNFDERAAATYKIYETVKENLERAASQCKHQRRKGAKVTVMHKPTSLLQMTKEEG